MILLKEFLYNCGLLHSLLHIGWFSLEMGLTENELEAIIRFKTEKAVHEELGRTFFK